MTESGIPTQEPQHLNVPRLMRGLQALVEPEDRMDRAALAALRRGLGKAPGEETRVFPVLVPLLPSGRLRARDEACAYLIAPLFATHPQSWSGPGDGRWDRNLGASLRTLRDRSDSDGPERRLVAILNTGDDELPAHLRHIIGLLRGQDIPVDWPRLAYDVLDWSRPSREVQRRWASAFWSQPEDSPTRTGEDSGQSV